MRVWFRHLRMALLALTMAVMVCSGGAGIFFRYFLNAPLVWSDELARYALVWMTFLGGAELFLNEVGHARIGFFVDKMGPRWSLVCELTAYVLILIIIVLMGVGSLIWMESSQRAFSTALSIPMPVIYAVIPASALFAGCIIIWRIAQLILRRNV